MIICGAILSAKHMKNKSTRKEFANIDEVEIAKFEAMAPIWWDKNGVQKPLHDINVLRIDYINSQAPLKGKKVLDVGCGGGILSEAMASLGALVTGIDASPAPLAVAKIHLKESSLHIDYQLSTAEKFSAAHSDRFDMVTCLELLEHVPEPASVVSACHRLVKPGGHVFFCHIEPQSQIVFICDYRCRIFAQDGAAGNSQLSQVC